MHAGGDFEQDPEPSLYLYIRLYCSYFRKAVAASPEAELSKIFWFRNFDDLDIIRYGCSPASYSISLLHSVGMIMDCQRFVRQQANSRGTQR